MSVTNLAELLNSRQFPGMTLTESGVAREWIRAHAFQYDSIEWNVRLGDGVELGPEFDEATRRAARLNSQKRADFIARGPLATAIVEVKNRLDARALGQLLMYRQLLSAMRPISGPVLLYAAGARIDPDTRPTFEAAGIIVEIYPVP